ncbi:hypothetical protein HMPREF9402_2867 [Turicibacter sp. HGF1]|nr:hypothetical protein [Turicibacter sp. HGF1]EGC92672.1 hypothetical protein HMPREF9402_2867 [Turicibacter sp. HGF1]
MKITRTELKQSVEMTVDECVLNPDMLQEISQLFAQLDLNQLGYDD